MIGAGAKILGNIDVGPCARVAAGSVVLNSVPAEFDGRRRSREARRYGWLPRAGPRHGPDLQQTRLRFFQLFDLTSPFNIT